MLKMFNFQGFAGVQGFFASGGRLYALLRQQGQHDHSPLQTHVSQNNCVTPESAVKSR